MPRCSTRSTARRTESFRGEKSSQYRESCWTRCACAIFNRGPLLDELRSTIRLTHTHTHIHVPLCVRSNTPLVRISFFRLQSGIKREERGKLPLAIAPLIRWKDTSVDDASVETSPRRRRKNFEPFLVELRNYKFGFKLRIESLCRAKPVVRSLFLGIPLIVIISTIPKISTTTTEEHPSIVRSTRSAKA